MPIRVVPVSLARSFVAALSILLVLSTRPVWAGEPPVYSLMIVPQWRPVVVERTWRPFLEELSRRTGLQFRFLTPQSIPDFEDRLLAGKADFAYMNPYHAILAKHRQDYAPLVRSGDKALHGILVVLKNSAIKGIKQLDGKQVAFPSANAFGASLYMRALLDKQHHLDIRPRYVNTHANVYRNVVFRNTVAGGGVNKTLDKENHGIREQLEVLYETPGVAPHPLSVHPRVPAAHRRLVQQAILDMWQDGAGKKMLSNVQLASPVRADYARDYAPLEKLGLEKYAE